MSGAILVEKGGDLIQCARDRLLADGGELCRSLVIFPGQRPAHFLHRALASALKKPFAAPEVCSIDVWVDRVSWMLGHHGVPLTDIDGVTLLYRLHREEGMPGTSHRIIPLDAFLPWGFKLYSDFEELAIEGLEPGQLKDLQAIAEEALPPRIRGGLSDLAGLYNRFYDKLAQDGLSTRSLRYRWVAGECQRLDLASYRSILLVGFFALSEAETRIFRTLLESEKTSLLLQDGPGIEGLAEKLGCRLERRPESRPSPQIHYCKVPDTHGEVMRLNEVLRRDGDHSRQVVVLPSPGTLFPVIQHTLPLLDDDWNVSIGYPLVRTPIFSLIMTIGRALENRDAGRYFLADYLRLVLHPYVKNLALKGASYPSRVLFHTVEEELTRRQMRFISLEELETDVKILKETQRRLSGTDLEALDEQQLIDHLCAVHRVLLRPFEQSGCLGDICRHLLDLVSYVSTQSPINQHPYASRFVEALIGALNELLSSDISRESFTEVKSYFAVLQKYLQGVAVPFPGTPLKGLQVLGFLETRNLGFDTVYFLDANEGVIPSTRKEDTLLPMGVRQALQLPTNREREAIVRYYFENLIAAAREVFIFYREGEDQERSRLVERLLWEEQKETKSLELKNQSVVFFESRFNQDSPRAIAKNRQILDVLSERTFSASLVDTYLACPLQFFYRHVLKLEERAQPSTQPEPAEIGILVHDILKRFFDSKRNHPLSIELEDRGTIGGIAEAVFEEKFGQHQDGGTYLITSQVRTRLLEILTYHSEKHRNVVITDCEKELRARIEVAGVGPVDIQGRLDRIQRDDSGILILDYKTGTRARRPTKGFTPEAREDWHTTLSSVQLPLYLLLYLENYRERNLSEMNSGVMLLGFKATREEMLFADQDDKASLFRAYRVAIDRLIGEILDPQLDFGDTPDPEGNCGNCGYKVMCGRQWIKGRG